MTDVHLHHHGLRPAPAPFAATDALRAMGLAALALAAWAAGLRAGPAWSHGIQSNLEKVSPLSEQVRREFQLQSEFSTGEPAGDAAVRLWRPGGETVELGRTDPDGRLRFALPSDTASDWELQVDAGPGHRDYLEFTEADGQARQPSRPRTALQGLITARPEAALPAGVSGLKLGGVLVGGTAVGLGAGAALALGRRSRRHRRHRRS
jgi:nickel transport protein